MNKPITIARRDYLHGIVDLSNKSMLPAFVMVDVLERVTNELRQLAEGELKHDEATYRAALQKEQQPKAESEKVG